MASYTGDENDNSWTGDLEHRNIAYLAGGSDYATGGDLTDNLSGGEGDDTLYGFGGDDRLEGGPGDDNLWGGDGADLLFSGSGLDYLNGGTGDDTLTFNQGAEASGSTGDDLFRFIGDDVVSGQTIVQGDEGDDVVSIYSLGHGYFDGGVGDDTITYEYAGSEKGVVVNLLTGIGAGAALGDTYIFIENARGTAQSDTFQGNGSINALYGLGGNDTLAGGGGGDYLDGGDGIDVLNYSSSAASVTVSLAAGTAYGGDAQEDIFRNIENVLGSAFGDRLTGDAGANTLRGDKGNDVLTGGLGSDTLVGGAGADRFAFASTLDTPSSTNAGDRITDFSHDQGDRIDLAAIDANTAAARDQAFSFIAAQKFHGVAGELRYTVSGGHALIMGDVNGDKVPDFQINVTVDAAHPLVAADFVL
jgi:Ca2+-binding RTX toxin-like protein